MIGMDTPPVNDAFLLRLLQACAERAPLYPKQFAEEQNLSRELLDQGLDELRRRGLVKLTEWVKDHGQGCAATEAGLEALRTRRLPRAPVIESGPELVRGSAPNAYQRGEIIRQAFLQPRPPYVTRILLFANIAYFAFGAFYAWHNDLSVEDYLSGNSPPPKHTTNAVLIELGALHPDLVFPKAPNPDLRPQFERIVLFFFLHIGLIHLGMNMYFLFALGRQIEALWGSLRYLAIYMNAGIVSGCVILLIATWSGLAALTAGASGALYGIFAGLLVWFLLNYRYMPPALIQAISRNLGVNLLLLVAINFIFTNVSWQGHLGGAIGGFLTALLLHVQRFHSSGVVRLLAVLCVPLVPVGFFLAVLWQAGWIVLGS